MDKLLHENHLLHERFDKLEERVIYLYLKKNIYIYIVVFSFVLSVNNGLLMNKFIY
jgi:hypothetical protein